ncbi:sulfite exporter TauE/SafE family protein [Rapidithrix thailandica]|uniref:Sulfite exporter TauE/SafE family protein n=1 Tax=Rapidithrix thailandica TaxID=413964 RepID=A0AAW9RS62_9BACT
MVWTAFLLGMMGSFHCLGMCGPIALAIQGKTQNTWKLLIERLLYNLGRAFTYSLLGAIAGLIGQSLAFVLGYQLYITFLLGVFMLCVGLFAINPDHLLSRLPLIGSWMNWVRQQLGLYLKKAGFSTYFTIGMLNGFLPCGLVYMGLTGALASGNALNGMGYMFLFGLGTLPMMFSVAVAGKFVQLHIRNLVKKLYPVLFIAMGVFFMYRAWHIHQQSGQLLSGRNPQQEMLCQ